MLKPQIFKAIVLRHFVSTADLHVMASANEWALSSSLTEKMHDGVLHPVQYCRQRLKEGEINYHPAEREVLSLIMLLKITHALLAGKVIHAYTRFLTMERAFHVQGIVLKSRQLYFIYPRII